MNLFRTEAPICVSPVEVLENGDWREAELRSEGGLILTSVSSQEHDLLLDIHQGFDPGALRGILASLHVKEGDGDDPKTINLLALPAKDQIIRHQDRYYKVTVVVQSSNGSAAVFVKKISMADFLRWTS